MAQTVQFLAMLGAYDAIIIGVILAVIAYGIWIKNQSPPPPPPRKTNNLTTCPDCGREISFHANQCPHCGRPSLPKAFRVDDDNPYNSPRG